METVVDLIEVSVERAELIVVKSTCQNAFKLQVHYFQSKYMLQLIFDLS